MSKWLYEKGLSKVQKSSESLLEDLSNGIIDINHVMKFKETWYKYFNRVLKDFGFKRKRDRKYLFNFMITDMNWEHLHQTNEEREKVVSEWIEDFKSDVFYCSDRWCFTRLIRNHWRYVQILDGYSRALRDDVFNTNTEDYLDLA